MIAYAACVGDPEKYRRICLPGLRRVAGPDDLVIEAEHDRSIFAAYNEVLDAVRDRDDLEALVLLHEDTEIAHPAFADMIRRHVGVPDVAVVGTVGARGIEGLAWWEASCYGRVAETRGVIDFGGGTHDVDTVDGLVMGLSPWAVRNLRFDEESYVGFDAYDADLCAQARAAGKRVLVTELPVVHLHDRVGGERATSDGGSFVHNDAVFREKWAAGQTESAEEERHATAGVRASKGDDGYFELTRPELRSLVPQDARRVLDVGCGAGSLGAALKADRGCEVVGLEGFPEAAELARERLDDAHCVDLDTLEAMPGEEDAGFDAMIFGDVLEHLRDPERLLGALLPALAPGGTLIFSVPNVKHWSVVMPLVVDDRFTYEDSGLLDRTHVHLFTMQEFGEMLARLGVEVEWLGVNDHSPLPEELDLLPELAGKLGGDKQEAAARFGAYQYLVTAKKTGQPAARPDESSADHQAAASDHALHALVPDGAERVLDVREGVAPNGSYDAILLRDVLEHDPDPAGVLRSLVPHLSPGGVVVCAVPNVKHWTVLYPLIAADRWTYGSGGALERGHIRFFTLDELSELLEGVGLEGVQVASVNMPMPPQVMPLVNFAIDFGAEHDETLMRLEAREYLVAAQVRAA